ncbi:MAG: hypothetical protein ABR974_14490 [Bacteroidales bacterium]
MTDSVRPWFTETTGHYLFQADIEFHKNHFSGIMVLKRTGEKSFRVVYMTELGMKVFDMEFFEGGEAKVFYFLDAIDRKIILKTIKEDIGLALGNYPVKKRLKISENTLQNKILLEYGTKSVDYYCFVDSRTRNIEHILKTRCRKKIADITYISNEHNEIESITIQHFNIKLKIQLFKLKETQTDASEQTLLYKADIYR